MDDSNARVAVRGYLQNTLDRDQIGDCGNSTLRDTRIWLKRQTRIHILHVGRCLLPRQVPSATSSSTASTASPLSPPHHAPPRSTRRVGRAWSWSLLATRLSRTVTAHIKTKITKPSLTFISDRIFALGIRRPLGLGVLATSCRGALSRRWESPIHLLLVK